MDGSAARDNLEIAGRDSYIVSFIGAVYLLVNTHAINRNAAIHSSTLCSGLQIKENEFSK